VKAIGAGIYALFGALILFGLIVWARSFAEAFRATFWPPETPGETPRFVERFVCVGGSRFTYPMRCHLVVTASGITFAVCPMLYRLTPTFPRKVFIPHRDAKAAIATRDGRPVLEIVVDDQVWWLETKDPRGLMRSLMPPRARG
jgi:hypothetical protein